MKDKILQAVIASEKSCYLLTLLDSGPKNFEELCIRSRMHTKEYLISIKSLEEHNLITGENGTYKLTSSGELIVEMLKPFSHMKGFMNTNDCCRQNHSLDFIPPHLLKRLHELDSCTVIQTHLSDIFDYHKEIYETSKSSRSVIVAASGLYPGFPKLFSHLTDDGVSLSLLFDSCLYEKLLRDKYLILQKLVNNKQVTLHVYPKKMHIFSFIVNDSCLFLEPLTNEGMGSHKQLLFNSPGAIKWGNDLFHHHLQDSTPITEI